MDEAVERTDDMIRTLRLMQGHSLKETEEKIAALREKAAEVGRKIRLKREG